jgi:hypothetical protein
MSGQRIRHLTSWLAAHGILSLPGRRRLASGWRDAGLDACLGERARETILIDFSRSPSFAVVHHASYCHVTFRDFVISAPSLPITCPAAYPRHVTSPYLVTWPLARGESSSRDLLACRLVTLLMPDGILVKRRASDGALLGTPRVQGPPSARPAAPEPTPPPLVCAAHRVGERGRVGTRERAGGGGGECRRDRRGRTVTGESGWKLEPREPSESSIRCLHGGEERESSESIEVRQPLITSLCS